MIEPSTGQPARRCLTLVAAAWLGLLLAVALLAAPAAFQVLERPVAGRLVARLFAAEANTSLALAIATLLLERWRARLQADAPTMNAVWMLALGALFCTVAGYHALQPMMQAARAGQGGLSFASLHAVSLGFYALKILLVGGLSWIVSRPQAEGR